MLEDVMVISRYPSASFDTILSNLFWNVLLHPGGGGGGRDLPWSLVMSLSRMAARTVLFLSVKTVSADPPEAINFSNFFQPRKHCSCSFLSIHLYWNVSFCFYLCFSRQLKRFGAKKLISKIIFNATVKV
jgi:hypothetical protein